MDCLIMNCYRHFFKTLNQINKSRPPSHNAIWLFLIHPCLSKHFYNNFSTIDTRARTRNNWESIDVWSWKKGGGKERTKEVSERVEITDIQHGNRPKGDCSDHHWSQSSSPKNNLHHHEDKSTPILPCIPCSKEVNFPASEFCLPIWGMFLAYILLQYFRGPQSNGAFCLPLILFRNKQLPFVWTLLFG